MEGDKKYFSSGSTKEIIYQVCLKEQWRFQDMIVSKNVEEACYFEFVPIHYGTGESCEAPGSARLPDSPDSPDSPKSSKSSKSPKSPKSGKSAKSAKSGKSGK